MGYDLNLVMATDEQIAYLKSRPEFTREFIEAERPVKTIVQTVGKWFFKKEVSRVEALELAIAWPAEPAAITTLYLRGGIYYLLNGTNENVESVSNFPNVGGRYRGEMQGPAVELGDSFLGHAHGFFSAQVVELREQVFSLTETLLADRAKTISIEMEWDNAAQVAKEDIAALKALLAQACNKKLGLIWYWS